MSGGGGSDTQKQISEPWSGQIPYLTGPAGVPHQAAQPSDLWLNYLQSVGQGYVRPAPGMTATEVMPTDPYGAILAGAQQAPIQTPTSPVVDRNALLQSEQDRQLAASSLAANAWKEYNDAATELSRARSGMSDTDNPKSTWNFDQAQNRVKQAQAFLEQNDLWGTQGSPAEKSSVGYWMNNPAALTAAQPGVQYSGNQPIFGRQMTAPNVATPSVGGVNRATTPTKTAVQTLNPAEASYSPMVRGMTEGATRPSNVGGVQGILGGYQGQVANPTTSNQTPGVLPSAAQWYQGEGEQYFPGATVAGRTPGQYYGDVASTLAGLQQLQTAQELQPRVEQTYGMMNRNIQDILTRAPQEVAENPYFDRAMQSYADQALDVLRDVRLPSIARETLGTGTYGSARQGLAEAGAVGETQKAISQAGAALAHQDYQNYLAAQQAQRNLEEQQRQSAMGMAPDILAQYGAAKSMPAAALQQLGATTGNIGQQYQQWGQNLLGGEQERYNFYQQQPYNMLQRYAGLVGGPLAGGTTTATGTQAGQNPWAGALGGAASGAAMGSAVPVIGTGMGAAIGGLMGYFGSR